MTRSTFKTLFYINRSKEKKNGKCPIMGRITIDGEQVQYSTGKEIAPELWDSRKGRCKGIGEETKEINRYLQTKEEQAKAKYQELVWQRGYITAELLKRELMEEDNPKGFLLEEARLFIEEKRPCVGLTIAKPTFANYIYAAQLIKSYLRERLGLEDIRYSLLDYGFIEGLDFYLKSERNLSLATIQVAVIFLRKLIGIGQQKKYIRIDPFADYKAELPHRTRRYLTTEDLQTLSTVLNNSSAIRPKRTNGSTMKPYAAGSASANAPCNPIATWVKYPSPSLGINAIIRRATSQSY